MKRKSAHSNLIGPKGKDLTIFVRFGGLDLKNQEGYNTPAKNDFSGTFHKPPATRGFYAMPKIYQEFFLVGSLYMTQPEQFPGKVDKDGNYTYTRGGVDKIMRLIRKEFKKIDGNVWHHLGEYVPVHEIIDRHDCWVKTSLSTWRNAINKVSLNRRLGDEKWRNGNKKTSSIIEAIEEMKLVFNSEGNILNL